MGKLDIYILLLLLNSPNLSIAVKFGGEKKEQTYFSIHSSLMTSIAVLAKYFFFFFFPPSPPRSVSFFIEVANLVRLVNRSFLKKRSSNSVSIWIMDWRRLFYMQTLRTCRKVLQKSSQRTYTIKAYYFRICCCLT